MFNPDAQSAFPDAWRARNRLRCFPDDRAADADVQAGQPGHRQATPRDMEPKLQKRVQRYGWDLAVDDYEPLWGPQVDLVQRELLRLAAPQSGERVLDVACGTGLVSFDAAWEVGKAGSVVGVDISGHMVEAAERRMSERVAPSLSFARMDAEHLLLPDGGFDVVLCALGLMYAPHPEQALAEMRRVLRPGGRMVAAVWGDRDRVGWSPVFEIVDAEVQSDVCPLFFRLGSNDTLARLCTQVGFETVRHQRIHTALAYADADEACDAAFIGGPVALAWSRFDAAIRARARDAYLSAITPWRRADGGYVLPGEFVIVSATNPLCLSAPSAAAVPPTTRTSMGVQPCAPCSWGPTASSATSSSS
jgi:ubiquinone/menaquinone biosynthesis C-methylase UbiE